MSYTATPTSVGELVAHLLTLDQSLPVAYELHSEQCLLGIDDLKVEALCLPRPDGWVQNKRPDMPSQDYLVFPGN